MATRLYVVIDKANMEQRLVRATYKLMALRHAAAQRFDAKIASKDDIERLLTKGIKVEDANEEQIANESLDE
jgi:hypothetical protein